MTAATPTPIPRPTPAAPGAPADREARRRRLEGRATLQAFLGAAGMVASIGLWFWGILAVVQIGLGVLLPRLLDVLGSGSAGASVQVGPVGAPQVFLFVMGIITGSGFLDVHVAAGATRRSAWRGWVLAAPAVGIAFAAVGLLTTALARLVAAAIVPDQAAAAGAHGPFDDALPVAAALAVLGATAFLVGIAVNLVYRHLGGGLGTLALPVALAPVVLAHVVLLQGGASTPDGGSVPGVGTSPLGWSLAVVCLALTPPLLHVLLRRLPIT